MLIGLGALPVCVLFISGIALDLLLGEARRWHPLAGFGRWAMAIEALLNRGAGRLARGVAAWLCAVLPLVLAAWLTIAWLELVSVMLAMAAHALLLYFALGLRSLQEHTAPIAAALLRGDLPAARALVARIVSRDTTQSDTTEVAKAAIESLLENGNDAVFGALFWFIVAGGPGALLFRLANTLDAMWGYRNARFAAFGWMAARTDDALNWLPARLTALSYALFGNRRRAWQCWRTQAPAWPSPNAGPVMAAGAGALGLALGGMARYDGVVELRPPLGLGREPQAHDIGRAWRLLARGVALWVLALAATAAIATIASVLLAASAQGGWHA